MSSVGKQLGSWVGQWLGGIETDPNRMYGTAAGTSTVAGTLVDGAGPVSGDVTLVGVSATASVGVLQAEGVAAQRSRRNVRFIPYREGLAYLQGVDARTKVGTLVAHGVSVSYKPISISAKVFPHSQRANTAVGGFSVTAGASVQLRGVSARTKLRAPSPSAASAVRMAGVRAIARCGTVAPSGGAIARAQWMEESEVFVGDIVAHGIQNPTDEQLASLAILLTRRPVQRI